MRTQACREKIHKTAEMCDLSPETVAEIDRVTGFVEKHKDLSRLTTAAIKPLMRIKDPETKEKAISYVEKVLNRKTPTGGTYTKRLTEPEVEKIIEKVSPPENPKTEIPVIPASQPAPVVPAVPAPEQTVPRTPAFWTPRIKTVRSIVGGVPPAR